MNRWDKLEWLKETCSQDFIENNLMDEMARWMGEDDFEQFYDHLCRMWDIARSPEDLNYRMGIVDEVESEEKELAYP
jgi:hypothetical protein